MSVRHLDERRPYDRVDDIHRRLGANKPITADDAGYLLDVIADQRASLAALHDEQWQEAYQNYLLGPVWQALKEAAKRNAGYQCELCARRQRLQVHHRDYTHVFHETPEDLIVLCARCHAKHHGRTS